MRAGGFSPGSGLAGRPASLPWTCLVFPPKTPPPENQVPNEPGLLVTLGVREVLSPSVQAWKCRGRWWGLAAARGGLEPSALPEALVSERPHLLYLKAEQGTLKKDPVGARAICGWKENVTKFWNPRCAFYKNTYVSLESQNLEIYSPVPTYSPKRFQARYIWNARQTQT